MVFVCTRDRCTTYWRCRGTSNSYSVGPGSVCVAPCHFEVESCWQSNPWHLLAVAIDTSKLRHIAPLQAKAMLEESRSSIGEIAFELGFPSHSPLHEDLSQDDRRDSKAVSRGAVDV